MDATAYQPSDNEELSPAVGDLQASPPTVEKTSAVARPKDAPTKNDVKAGVQPYDFRCPAFLSPNELRKLRVHHEAFIQSLASRLSTHLRADLGLRMAGLESLSYQKFTDGLADPCHAVLFKADPLRGICILDLDPQLGLAIIDRLMGGPGSATSVNRDLSNIEMALLEQVVRLIVEEWCSQWCKVQELQPVMLGHENNGRFLQTSQADAVMLVLAMEARMGDCTGTVRLVLPYATLEPLIRGLGRQLDKATGDPATAGAEKPAWSHDFDEVKISMIAECSGIRLSARELTRLRTGDIIPLPADFTTLVRLRVANTPRFTGRLGACGRQAAVEITRTLPI